MELFSVGPKVFGAIKDIWTYFQKRWWPPKYGYRLAYSNILEVVKPYTYRPKVVELLGQPHECNGSRTGYRFSNAFLQVNYAEDSVESVALVLLRPRWPNRFKIHPMNLTLGASTFKDACSHDIQGGALKMKVNNSSKFYCLWNEQYFGNRGRYLYYSFALLEADTFPTISMPPADYVAVDPGHVEHGAVLQDSSRKFNAIWISRNEDDGMCIDFTLFR